jgi:hypothetical protein
MKLKVYVIDFETPRWLRKLAAWVAPMCFVLGGGVVLAAPPTLHTWAPSDPLKSTDLNGNFTAMSTYAGGLETRIGAMESGRVVATINGQPYSVGATKYCGATPLTSGGVSGYLGAKSQCGTACSSTSAHMCTGDELVRAAAVGQTTPIGWYAGAMYAAEPGTSNAVDDCLGFTRSSVSYGQTWGGSTQAPTNDACSSSHPILCCD